MTEIFIERALQRAQEVDDYLKTHGKVIGPLHGLPISLKDQFCLKGMETIMGMYHIDGYLALPCTPGLVSAVSVSFIYRESSHSNIILEASGCTYPQELPRIGS